MGRKKSKISRLSPKEPVRNDLFYRSLESIREEVFIRHGWKMSRVRVGQILDEAERKFLPRLYKAFKGINF